MSGRDRVREMARVEGWGVLTDEASRLVVYRWGPGMVRHEVCFTFDNAARIRAVSAWENRRTLIDQKSGCRARGEALLSRNLWAGGGS